MEPLDLTKTPPREPRQELDGIAFMPRTIDKVRGNLPGGDPGVYNFKGFSQMLAEAGGVTEDQLLDVVASATTDEDVAAWLRKNADRKGLEALSKKILDRRVADVKEKDPEGFAQRYPVSKERDDIEFMVDMLAADDADMFK
jgi:pyrroloquinoline quinone (PQQ) biosynthesis protein C